MQARPTAAYEAMRRRSTDELLEMWCKHDRMQWSEAAFDAIRSTLAERGVAVPAVAEAGAAERPSAGTGAQRVVTLACFATQGEAQLARSLLAAGGIEAVVVSEAAYRLTTGEPIRLQVRDRDAARAAELLGLGVGHATELEAAAEPAGRGTEPEAAMEPAGRGTELASTCEPGFAPAVPAPQAPEAEAEAAASDLDRPAVEVPSAAHSRHKPVARWVALLMLAAMLLSAVTGAWRMAVELARPLLVGF